MTRLISKWGILSLLFVTAFAKAQTEGVSIKTTSSPPDASAMLEVASTTKGVLIPRVALVSVTNGSSPISNPANSLLVYNTNAGLTTGTGYYYWDQPTTTWIKLASGSGSTFWTQIGTSNDIQYSGGKVRVGSGSLAPNYDFEVEKPSDFNIIRWKGWSGEMRYGAFDTQSGGGPASYFTQTSGLDGGNNWLTIRYAQVHGNGVKGLSLNTWIRPNAAGTSALGWTTIDANHNSMYLTSDDNIIFLPFGFGGCCPAAWFNPSGGFVNPSDSTRKTNITNMDNTLAKIMAARPVTFNWKTNPNGPKNYGLIAQEIEQLFPELVYAVQNMQVTDPASGATTAGPEMKGINYIALTAILIKAMQQQQAQIQNLQTRVTALESR